MVLAKSNVGANVDIDRVGRYIENWDILELNENKELQTRFLKKFSSIKEDSVEPEIFIQWII